MPQKETSNDQPVTGDDFVSLSALCEELSICMATGRNWVRLGKLAPAFEIEQAPFFHRSYIARLKAELLNGKNAALKSRRNKKYVSGSGLYRAYAAQNAVNLAAVREVIRQIAARQIEITGELLSALLAECALQLLHHRKTGEERGGCLPAYLHGALPAGDAAFLIEDMLCSSAAAKRVAERFPELFRVRYAYEAGEDTLGLLYISLLNLGRRKAAGVYYTPDGVVKRLCRRLFAMNDAAGRDVLDPCCGTGNFILQLPPEIAPAHIYGIDADPLSVRIARVNYALKYDVFDAALICAHIRTCDYLSGDGAGAYDFILGNPPWGREFSKGRKGELRKKYAAAKGARVESYDLFIEQALADLKAGGVLSFVLPEAFLQVKSHAPYRRLLQESCTFQYLEYLGNAFDRVQCPGIILQAARIGASPAGPHADAAITPHADIAVTPRADTAAIPRADTAAIPRADTAVTPHADTAATPHADAAATPRADVAVGLRVNDGAREFTVRTPRSLSDGYAGLLATDEEYALLEKLDAPEGKLTLAGRAAFALGIVTGNNRKYVLQERAEGSEPVLTGADLRSFRYRSPERYIIFRPEAFQQTAPVRHYRAKEKLLYRFICDRPVFAYDDRQLLSLNSCNILIPAVSGLEIKYILAVLNARTTRFYFQKRFRSVKVLRAQLEQLPIPVAKKETRDRIVALVDRILKIPVSSSIAEPYEALDREIAALYALTDAEYALVRRLDMDTAFG